jgi:NADPH2:quinone reductase
MRAAFYEANGAARAVLQVGELPMPEPGPGEVRVRIRASGINPSDVKARSGATRKIAFPRIIPHSDGAGEIDKLGAGVTDRRIGDRVWLWNAQYQRPCGTAADYAAVPAAQAVPLPERVSFAAGACLGVPAMTAWHAVMLDGAEALSGSTILVAGGAGAVAHYAIQFAKATGAIVITTVSSDMKAQHARAAGADHVIDYKREDVGARVREITGGTGVARIIEVDLARNAPLIAKLLAPRGTVVVYGSGGGEATIGSSFLLNAHATMKFFIVYGIDAAARGRAVAGIGAALAGGRLINAVAREWPLEEIAVAHEAVEAGTLMGKAVVLPGEIRGA